MKNTFKFGLLALIIVIIQSILKLIGVVFTESLSFLSETIDTIIDIFFVALTLFSIYISQQPADYEHMYGHVKIDSIGALIQGIILINIYFVLIINASQILINQTYMVENPSFGLIILIISMIINLVFSRVLIWQGKKYYSLSLEVQGLNLFQDSLRAVITIINLLFVIFLGIEFLDPILSIIISILIIISAILLVKNGIKDLIDVNPINMIILEDLKYQIFNLDHVNGVGNLRVRASGNTLFIEINLAVEDHISIAHANEINNFIRRLCKKTFSKYEVDTIIEMNPLRGEDSMSENLMNLISSLKVEFPEIIDTRELNVFKIKDEYFISLVIEVHEKLSLKEAHQICTEFEDQLKDQAPSISRIITNIEGKSDRENYTPEDLICQRLDSKEIEEDIRKKVTNILKSKSYVKGYHGFEVWKITDNCLIEMHIFFEGNLNISVIHDYILELEKLIRKNIKLDNLEDIILHSEPYKGRTDGIFFN